MLLSPTANTHGKKSVTNSRTEERIRPCWLTTCSKGRPLWIQSQAFLVEASSENTVPAQVTRYQCWGPQGPAGHREKTAAPMKSWGLALFVMLTLDAVCFSKGGKRIHSENIV